MKNTKTTFTNSTSNPNLRNPFEAVPPSKYDSLPSYLKSLSEELLHYHPSIKSTTTITIDGENVDITITMKD